MSVQFVDEYSIRHTHIIPIVHLLYCFVGLDINVDLVKTEEVKQLNLLKQRLREVFSDLVSSDCSCEQSMQIAARVRMHVATTRIYTDFLKSQSRQMCLRISRPSFFSCMNACKLCTLLQTLETQLCTFTSVAMLVVNPNGSDCSSTLIDKEIVGWVHRQSSKFDRCVDQSRTVPTSNAYVFVKGQGLEIEFYAVAIANNTFDYKQPCPSSMQAETTHLIILSCNDHVNCPAGTRRHVCCASQNSVSDLVNLAQDTCLFVKCVCSLQVRQILQKITTAFTDVTICNRCTPDLSGQFVINLESIYAEMTKTGKCGIHSGIKLSVQLTREAADTGIVPNLVYHELGFVQPVLLHNAKLLDSECTNALACMMCLERNRQMVHTQLHQQTMSAVSLQNSRTHKPGYTMGRPSRIYTMMCSVAKQKGMLLSCATTSHPIKCCKGGIYWRRHERGVMFGVIDLDFSSHYPNSCITANISRERYVNKEHIELIDLTLKVNHILDAELRPPHTCEFEKTPFCFVETPHAYVAACTSRPESKGILPTLMTRLLLGRQHSQKLSKNALANGQMLAGRSHAAIAQWYKEESCCVVGVMASKSEADTRTHAVTDRQTAQSIYCEARKQLAMASNFICSNFASCANCGQTHYFGAEGHEICPGTTCSFPERLNSIAIIEIITDAMRIQTSENDDTCHMHRLASWITSLVHTKCFNHCASISLSISGCYSIFIMLPDRSVFALPCLEADAEDHTKWTCKGRTLNPGNVDVFELNMIRSTFALVASLHLQFFGSVHDVAVGRMRHALMCTDNTNRQHLFSKALQLVTPVASHEIIEYIENLHLQVVDA